MSAKAPEVERRLECPVCGRLRLVPPSVARKLSTCGSNECVQAYKASRRPGVAEKFWRHVEKTDGCWLWRASTKRGGYGQFRHNGVNYTATRLAYAMTYGEIRPESLFVCHRCDNPRCVRPDHLFLGTLAENHADMCRKGRQPKGSSHANAKLTEEAVVMIRGSRKPIKELAAALGVSESAVWQAQRGVGWTHVRSEIRADGYAGSGA